MKINWFLQLLITVFLTLLLIWIYTMIKEAHFSQNTTEGIESNYSLIFTDSIKSPSKNDIVLYYNSDSLKLNKKHIIKEGYLVLDTTNKKTYYSKKIEYKLERKLTGEWWTALGILLAIIFAFSAIIFVKEKDIVDINQSISDLKLNIEKENNDLRLSLKEVENLKITPNLLMNLQSEEVQIFSDKEKWQNYLPNINSLVNSNIFNKEDLHMLSRLAWIKGEKEVCLSLRHQAYKMDITDLESSSNLASFLLYLDDEIIERNELASKLFKEEAYLSLLEYNEIDLTNIPAEELEKVKKKDEKLRLRSISHKGLYYQKTGDIAKSIELLESILDSKRIQPFHLRNYTFSLLMSLNIETLKEFIEKLELEKNEKWLNSKYVKFNTYKLFLNAFINEWFNKDPKDKSELHSFQSQIPKSLIINSCSFNSVNRYSKWNFCKILQSIDENEIPSKQNLIDLYLSFYLFTSEDDIVADTLLLNKSEGMIKTIFNK